MGRKYRLTNEELKQVVMESVVRILNEDENMWETPEAPVNDEETFEMEKYIAKCILVGVNSHWGQKNENWSMVEARFFPSLRKITIEGQAITALYAHNEKLVSGNGGYGEIVKVKTTNNTYDFNNIPNEIQRGIYDAIKQRINLTR